MPATRKAVKARSRMPGAKERPRDIAMTRANVGLVEALRYRQGKDDSHLFEDKEPYASLKGGWTSKEKAEKSIKLVSKRSLEYQKDVILDMMNKAAQGNHRNETGYKDAIDVFQKWLQDNRYNKLYQNEYPLLKKETVIACLPLIEDVVTKEDLKWCEKWLLMSKWDRLSHTLLDEKTPTIRDMELVRQDALDILTARDMYRFDTLEALWDGAYDPDQEKTLSLTHAHTICYGYSTYSDTDLLKELAPQFRLYREEQKKKLAEAKAKSPAYAGVTKKTTSKAQSPKTKSSKAKSSKSKTAKANSGRKVLSKNTGKEAATAIVVE